MQGGDGDGDGPTWTHNEVSGTVAGALVQAGHVGQVQVLVHVDAPPRRALGGLPSAPTVFCGRDDELAVLLDHLEPAHATSERPAVVSVAGLAGVGKTALVTQAARLAAERGWFPGGAVFVDLHGYQGQRVEPGSALTMLLTALGLPGIEIPPDEQSRGRLYLSLLAELASKGNRLLIILDNAADEDQVRPLLPTDGATRAVLTSRHTLTGLDARHLRLDQLTPAAAADVIAGALRTARGETDPRVAEEPDQLARIAALCGGLPLALRIVAALLASHPARRLSTVAADLADEQSRLDELRHRDDAVRAAFDLSYRLLPPEAARLFRLLPLGAGPDISTMAAAALAKLDERTTRRLLDELTEAHLVQPGAADGRWSLHNLVRLYADELGQAVDERHYRQSSAAHLFAHYYISTINAVNVALSPIYRTKAEPTPFAAQVPIPTFTTTDEAEDWLAAEWRTVLAFATTPPPYQTSPAAIIDGFTDSLGPYLRFWGHFEELAAFSRVLVRSAIESGDGTREAQASMLLGQALRHVGRQRTKDARWAPLRVLVSKWQDSDRESVPALGDTAMTRSADYLDEAIIAYQRAIDLGERLTPAELPQLWRELGDTYFEKHQALYANKVSPHESQTTIAVPHEDVGAAKEIENAIAAFRNAVTQYANLRDCLGQTDALLDLAAALNEASRQTDAMAAVDNAISIAEQTDSFADVRALLEYGRSLRANGRLADAVSAFREADAELALWGSSLQNNLRHLRIAYLTELHHTLDEAGQPAKAARIAKQIFSLARDPGNRDHDAAELLFLGRFALHVGGPACAATSTKRAIEIYEQLVRPLELAEAHYILGEALTQLGRTPDAVTHYERARDAATIAVRHPDFNQWQDILFSLGVAYARAGRLDDAETAAVQLDRLLETPRAADIRSRVRQAREQHTLN